MIDLRRAQSITEERKKPVTSFDGGKGPSKISVARSEVCIVYSEKKSEVKNKFENCETKDLNDHG